MLTHPRPEQADPHRRRTRLAVLAAAVSGGLLLWNAASPRPGLWLAPELRLVAGMPVAPDGSIDFSSLPRRYWDDNIAAIAHHRGADPPAQRPPIKDWDPESSRDLFVLALVKASRAAGVSATAPWRTIDAAYLEGLTAPYLPPFEDKGRPFVLARAFDAIGGVAPGAMPWLGLLGALPLLLWLVVEFGAAGHGVAGAVFCLLFASSPYAIETLTLTHQPVAFYTLAMLVLMTFAARLTLRPVELSAGLLAAILGAGVLLAGCALGRSGSILLLPGFAAALALGLRAPWPGRLPLHAGLFLLGMCLVTGPFWIVRPERQHNVWMSLWQGLGDFDRDKGHVWDDKAARRFLVTAGFDVMRAPGVDFVSEESEAFFRSRLIAEVRDDPAWFARILTRRLLATVSQRKLWPMGGGGEPPFERSRHPNEGTIDKYYRRVTPADHLCLGRAQVEMPAALLLLPTLGLAALWLWDRRRAPSASLLARPLAFIACAATGALALPVAVTTAGAIETQAISLVYLAGAAFLCEDLARRARRAPSRRGYWM